MFYSNESIIGVLARLSSMVSIGFYLGAVTGFIKPSSIPILLIALSNDVFNILYYKHKADAPSIEKASAFALFTLIGLVLALTKN